MATYRGIKVTPENTHVEKAKAQPGIYRGIKHDAEPSKSKKATNGTYRCLLYTSPSPRDGLLSRMPSSA